LFPLLIGVVDLILKDFKTCTGMVVCYYTSKVV